VEVEVQIDRAAGATTCHTVMLSSYKPRPYISLPKLEFRPSAGFSQSPDWTQFPAGNSPGRVGGFVHEQ
jgi:hypothetical protein